MILLTSQTQTFYASNVDLQLDIVKRKNIAAEEVMCEAGDTLHKAR